MLFKFADFVFISELTLDLTEHKKPIKKESSTRVPSHYSFYNIQKISNKHYGKISSNEKRTCDAFWPFILFFSYILLAPLLEYCNCTSQSQLLYTKLSFFMLHLHFLQLAVKKRRQFTLHDATLITGTSLNL